MVRQLADPDSGAPRQGGPILVFSRLWIGQRRDRVALAKCHPVFVICIPVVRGIRTRKGFISCQHGVHRLQSTVVNVNFSMSPGQPFNGCY